MASSLPLLISLLTLLTPSPTLLTLASEGDRSPTFQSCLHHCHATGCTHLPPLPPNCQTACPHLNRLPVPLPLRLAAWSCLDDCKYNCMTDIELYRRVEEQRPVKYYGKWAFKRVMGMQEVVSVVLSLCNLAVHVYCCRGLVRSWAFAPGGTGGTTQRYGEGPGGTARRRYYPYLWIWVCLGVLHVNAWTWSAVFHCRDTHLTERLDYTSAATLVVGSTAATAARALGYKYRAAAAACGTALLACLAGHVRYMLAVRFDYGWNMTFCLLVGAGNTVCWLVFCHVQRHPYRRTMYCFLLLVHAALLLEVLDFPAWLGLVDAHACWHAATVPLVPLLYRFLHGDARWLDALAQLRRDKVLS